MKPAGIGGAPGVGAANPSAGADGPEHARLRRMCHEMEGLFVRELLSAMRKTAPQEGVIGNSQGEAMFTSLLDDALANRAAERTVRGIGEAMYRQLSRALPAEPAPGTAPSAASVRSAAAPNAPSTESR
jgi:Rod binding domain-containing protein